MTWRIDYSRDSLEFINKHALQDKVREELIKGKIRIIFYINKLEKALYIERIDFRGSVYK